MIIVNYEMERHDQATGVVSILQLGSESHTNIEEVLLPTNPKADSPIFFTKKFQGYTEYRWQVDSVSENTTAPIRTYIVKLRQRNQIEKVYYLKNILAVRNRNAAHVLHPWAIVEVEFGHSLSVAKLNGHIRTSKRYADTNQYLSMPKRRLAIVIQVLAGREELVQVVPISSRQPSHQDAASVDVTLSLANMNDYRKQSWAVCSMIQTVTASRIIAPMLKIRNSAPARDRTFRNAIRGEERQKLKDSIMFGVAAQSRVADTAALAKSLADYEALRKEYELLKTKASELEGDSKLLYSFADYMDIKVPELREQFSL